MGGTASYERVLLLKPSNGFWQTFIMNEIFWDCWKIQNALRDILPVANMWVFFPLHNVMNELVPVLVPLPVTLETVVQDFVWRYGFVPVTLHSSELL